MNRAETLAIMTILKAAYPQYYRNPSKQEAEGVVALWQDMFSADTYELVATAIKALIATDEKGFPPHIGAVREQMRKVLAGPDGEMSEQEAWVLVRRALSNGFYGAAQEYAKLPKVIQTVLGNSSVLRDWAMLDIREVDTVIASNFMRSYTARASHAREMERLPAPVLEMVRGLSERMRIDNTANRHSELPKALEG